MSETNRKVEYQAYKTKKAVFEQMEEELRSEECTLRAALKDDLWDAFEQNEAYVYRSDWFVRQRDFVFDVLDRCDTLDDCLYCLRRAALSSIIDGVECNPVLISSISMVCTAWCKERSNHA